MGTQEGGDKPQGDATNKDNNNNNNTTNTNTPTSNNNSSKDYKDIITAGNDTSTPGKKKPSFDNDFIIISEFSEQVGPVPIDIIPDSSSSGTFDLNTFVLKIMAVDFQNKSNDPQSYLKDSQVAMPEPNEDAYTYLHHFNLLDVYARGYVRPMCISYITHDRNKIMDYFHEIMAKVTKVTKVMKRANHKLFLRDLEDRMADVRHTQAVMSSGQDLDNISPTPITVNEYLADLEVMHQKFHRAVTLKQQRRAAREAAGGSKGSPHSQHSSQHRTTPQPDDDEDDFEDEEEGEHEEREGKEIPRKRDGTEKSLNKAVAELTREYQPQVIHSLHPRTLHGKSLRNLQGLCDGHLNKAMALIHSLHRHYSRPSTVLALDSFDTPSLMPASSLLTIGQSVMLNFNLEMDKYMNKVITYETERVMSAGSVSSVVFGEKPTTTTATTNSNNSSSLDDDDSSYDSAREDSIGSSASSPTRDELYLDLANGVPGMYGDQPSHVMRVPHGEHEENSSTPDASSPGEEKVSSPKAKLLSNINFFSANLWPPLGPQADYPGKGLLALRSQFLWLRHVVYSILRGRPVVIWGSAQNETTVRGIVQALSVLVAGNNAGVTPWRTKSLKMSDLATFKLTGLIRSCQIAKAVEKYVTILDLENESLKSPPYPTQGKFIDEILALKKQWPDELSYLAHVHYVLFDIGVKSCLYYHLCCVSVHQLTPQQASQASHAYSLSSFSSSSSHHSFASSTSSAAHFYPHLSHASQPYPHHYHTYHAGQLPLPRSHSPHASQVYTHLRPHAPPSPRQPPQQQVANANASANANVTQSHNKPPSQPPSPHPSQPPSPHRSQPPSPRQPQPSQSQSVSQPPSHQSNSALLPSHPLNSHSQPPATLSHPPPNTFIPLSLGSSQEISPPPPTNSTNSPDSKDDLSPTSTDSKPESPTFSNQPESPKADAAPAEPLFPKGPSSSDDVASRTRSDSKNGPDAVPKRKKSVVSMLSSQPVRSHSMSSIGEKYRPAINSAVANNSASKDGTANSTNNNNNTTTNSMTTSNTTSGTNIGINSSANIPATSFYGGNVKPGEEWRNSSSPSPSSSRHASWQYGKAFGVPGHRSLSDSQISPIWLPTSPATREKTRSQFFHQFEITQGDTDIVMYLAEVVKEQQASEVQGTETPVIRLDYSSCQVFHSKITKEGSHTRRG